MSTVVHISRRDFLGSVFSAGALVLAAQVLPAKALGTPAAAAGAAAPWDSSVYLGIEPTGTVTIVAHRSEMGTGIRTALPMVAADELDADWQQVKIEQALGDPQYGDQNTDGSKSIRDFYDALREAGATARLMLERAAAATWGVPAAECRARQHQVTHATSGRGRVQGRQGCRVGGDPESAGRAGNGGQRPGDWEAGCRLPRDAARRRVRAEIETRLCG